MVASLRLLLQVLGYGSHGTVVFQGTLGGRSVAVKRILAEFISVAEKVGKLLSSLHGPNLMRFVFQARHVISARSSFNARLHPTPPRR